MFFEIKSNIDEYFHSGRLPLVLDSVGSLSYQPLMERKNGFRCHHFLWVTKGAGIFTVNGKTATLSKGEGVYFNAGVPHSYKAAEDGIFGSMWVTFYGLDALLQSYNVGDHFFFTATDRLQSAAGELYRHSTGNSTVISRSALLYSLITGFLASHFAPSTSLGEKLDRYLEVHFAEDLSLDDIAKAMKLNKYTLCKQYRQIACGTVIDRLKQIRIAKAKQYLLNTSHSVEEIGKLCGFQSPSYFGKVFREVAHTTPKSYRNNGCS